MEATVQKILENCEKNLARNRVPAVGIGLFVLIVKGKEVLLRKRAETNSLIYDQDLSGKWELAGGGVDLEDLAPKGDYTGTIFNTLKKEIEEETGLILNYLEDNFVLLPAWLTDTGTGQIDLAFVTVINYNQLTEAEVFQAKINREEIKFFPIEVFSGDSAPNVISPRMRFMIANAIRYFKKNTSL